MDGKDYCVRNYLVCQNKAPCFEMCRKSIPERFFLPASSFYVNPFHKSKVIYPVSKLSKVHFKTGIYQEFPVLNPKYGVTKS